jgi:hypothetical protein
LSVSIVCSSNTSMRDRNVGYSRRNSGLFPKNFFGVPEDTGPVEPLDESVDVRNDRDLHSRSRGAVPPEGVLRESATLAKVCRRVRRASDNMLIREHAC